MRYVGIDIAKKDHQIAAVDEFGNVILKSFSAGNNESGFAKIAEKLEAARIESDECLVGMEATGHYWISLWEFLDANGYEVVVINPRILFSPLLAQWPRSLPSFSNMG